VQYDDELDEEFEEKLEKKLSIDEMTKTAESFDNPKGIEESNDSNVIDGPQIDPKNVDNLQKLMKNYSREKLMQILGDMSQKNNFDLGNNDFAKVSDAHRKNSKERLREKIATQRSTRKTKSAREWETEKRRNENEVNLAKNTPLILKNEEKQQIENIHNEHSCTNDKCGSDAHKHISSSKKNKQKKKKQKKKTKNTKNEDQL